MPQVTEAYEWQGRTVLAQDGEKIGTVKDVYTDYQTGKPEWATDPRFASFTVRLNHRDEITRALDEVFSTATTAEWLARLGGKVPVAPVYDVAQALDNPFVAEQGRVVDFQHPEHGNSRSVASPVRLENGAALPTRAAPRLGDDPEALLEELGYPARMVAALRAQKAVA